MIYKVNGYNSNPIYVVENQATFDSAKTINPDLEIVIGSQNDAQTLLEKKQEQVLIDEAVRFSICATFVNGNDTTWREVQDSDPEDTICQVFNTYTGIYTQYANKTEAIAANEQLKKEFLPSVRLDKLIELNSTDDLPRPVTQPKSQGTQTL
jgi:hypothetical protein